MPFVKGAPKPPGSGRRKGGKNKMGRDVRELARTHTPAAIAVLVHVMSDTQAPPEVRVTAASALLDMGHGAPQATALRNRTKGEHGAADAQPAGGAHAVDDLLAHVLDDMSSVDALPLMSGIDDLSL